MRVPEAIAPCPKSRFQNALHMRLPRDFPYPKNAKIWTRSLHLSNLSSGPPSPWINPFKKLINSWRRKRQIYHPYRWKSTPQAIHPPLPTKILNFESGPKKYKGSFVIPFDSKNRISRTTPPVHYFGQKVIWKITFWTKRDPHPVFRKTKFWKKFKKWIFPQFSTSRKRLVPVRAPNKNPG